MTADVLLQVLARRGIELRIAIRYRPKSAMTQELLDAMKVNKLALLAILSSSDPARGSPCRRAAARLIRKARRDGDADLARDLCDAWHERIAICTIDSGLPEVAAEAIAMEQLHAVYTKNLTTCQ